MVSRTLKTKAEIIKESTRKKRRKRSKEIKKII
jgi:hypothetical protein